MANALDASGEDGKVQFCNELQALLTAEDEARCRQLLLQSFADRDAAGAVLYSEPPGSDFDSTTCIHWAEDLSGELADLSVADVARDGIGKSPAWLHRWILQRKRPVRLGRVARFIPFSSRLVLRATKPPDRRGLRDLLFVPYHTHGHHFGMMVGLFSQPTETQENELTTLASTYLVRQVTFWRDSLLDAEPEHGSGADLNERQLECLQWIVAGKSLKETAMITRMSYANVRYHLDRAKEQTGLPSLQQLIAWAAIRYRLSPLGPEQAPLPPRDRTGT